MAVTRRSWCLPDRGTISVSRFSVPCDGPRSERAPADRYARRNPSVACSSASIVSLSMWQVRCESGTSILARTAATVPAAFMRNVRRFVLSHISQSNGLAKTWTIREVCELWWFHSRIVGSWSAGSVLVAFGVVVLPRRVGKNPRSASLSARRTARSPSRYAALGQRSSPRSYRPMVCSSRQWRRVRPEASQRYELTSSANSARLMGWPGSTRERIALRAARSLSFDAATSRPLGSKYGRV